MYDLGMLRLMADHNHWMNEKIYAVCATMHDAERKRDLGAFFRSVHGTLNHLLLVDHLWMGRILADPFPIRSLDQELYTDFSPLQVAQEKMDGDIHTFVAELTSARLAKPVNYVSFLGKQPVSLPLGLVLTHLFHHRTHHRGQVSTLALQLGYEVGVTDMIYMPGAARHFI